MSDTIETRRQAVLLDLLDGISSSAKHHSGGPSALAFTQAFDLLRRGAGQTGKVTAVR